MNEQQPVKMESKGVILRALKPSDYHALFKLREEVAYLHLWKGSYRVPTEKEYFQDLDTLQRSHIDAFFVVARSNDREQPVGMVHTFDTNLIDGYTFGAIILDPSFRRQNIGTQASLLFLRYIFALSPIRKVYGDVLEYNIGSLTLIRKLGFTEEGCFVAHKYFNGQYWNSFRFACFRENLANIIHLLDT
ncbi:MAG: GNAT family N-acetyltransferase [Anaerolineae bacterium]|nr:GNAT family N-acetyltransferase [Anaerolineae bacterium]